MLSIIVIKAYMYEGGRRSIHTMPFIHLVFLRGRGRLEILKIQVVELK